MILLLARTNDPMVTSVTRRLRERGAEVCWFDQATFPQQAGLALHLGGRGEPRRRWLQQAGQCFDLDRVKAVWYRPHGAPAPAEALGDARVSDFVETQATTLLNSLWHRLDCFWLPGPRAATRQAESKVWQLELAAELGFEIPPTLITNQPEEFVEFYRQHDGRLISKTIHNGVIWATRDQNQGAPIEVMAYATPVTPRDVGYAEALRYCPTIFQAYVPKQLELRVTVVGQQVFTCAIDSQRTHHTRYDWRRYDLKNTPHQSHTLPRAVEKQCLQLVERLGLCYGALDLILTPEGRYVFLEINPNGQFAWIEALTGLPISAAICELLLSHAGGTYAHAVQAGAA